MVDTDCTTALPAQTDVTLTASPIFGLTGTETNAAGYSLTFCYRCGILPSGQAEIFFDKIITVSANPLDCSVALTDAGFTNPAAIAFNSAGSSVSVTTDYTAIFTHSMTTDCPLTSCELQEPGCGTTLASQTDVTLGAGPSFGLSAVETNAAGYSLTFCFQCTIGTNVFTKDSITISQNVLDCSVALTDAGFTNPAPITYNSAGSAISVAADYTAIFTHSQTADCPLT